jgi:hypothetical protein
MRRDAVLGLEVFNSQITSQFKIQHAGSRATLRARTALRAPITIVDAHRVSDGRCDATWDGRHYPPLLVNFSLQFLAAAREVLQPRVEWRGAGHVR